MNIPWDVPDNANLSVHVFLTFFSFQGRFKEAFNARKYKNLI